MKQRTSSIISQAKDEMYVVSFSISRSDRPKEYEGVDIIYTQRKKRKKSMEYGRILILLHHFPISVTRVHIHSMRAKKETTYAYDRCRLLNALLTFFYQSEK